MHHYVENINYITCSSAVEALTQGLHCRIPESSLSNLSSVCNEKATGTCKWVEGAYVGQ